jgi:hypothetical protein
MVGLSTKDPPTYKLQSTPPDKDAPAGRLLTFLREAPGSEKPSNFRTKEGKKGPAEPAVGRPERGK